MADRKRRSVRQAINRKVSIYVELDTDDDLDLDPDNDYSSTHRASKRLRPSGTRSRQPPPQSDNSDDSDGSPPSESQVPTKPRRRKRRSLRQATRGANIIGRVSALVGRPRRRSTKPSKSTASDSKQVAAPPIPTDGVSPPWDTLPYAILLQIFRYTEDSPTWLLQTARGVCRAFAAPALAAFYRSPHLPTPAHITNLYTLISRPTNDHAINYKAMVRRLDLDIRSFTNRKDENDTSEVAGLIEALPQLASVLITSVQDKPPYRRHTVPRWKYPNALFESLDKTERKLMYWRWNFLFVREQKTAQSPSLYDYMRKYHQRPSFQSLRHLEISDYPAIISEEGQPPQEDKIAEAIDQLPNLRSLELETCDIVNARFLERLPKTLSRLRLANCEALDSEALQKFLSQDGGCLLEELVLDHNVCLDLAFLPLLRSTCSRLKVLSMDLHYYSQHHTVNDAEARYKHLLSGQDIPTWPSTLQIVELRHLQKWDADGAENLFSSLIDHAQDLPNLRRLVLHAHISISWRDRATFREQWIDKLRKVFLRRCKKPNPELASLKAFRTAKQLRDYQSATPSSSRRHFAAVSIPRVSHSNSDYSDHGDEAPAPTGRRSRRIADGEKHRAEKAISLLLPPKVDIDEADTSSDSADEDNADPPAFVQGMCNVVDVMIDNQRPREEQFNESHFLDSEESGDEDWNEGGEVHDDDGYAW